MQLGRTRPKLVRYAMPRRPFASRVTQQPAHSRHSCSTVAALQRLSCRRLSPALSRRPTVQVTTLFDDLDEEISTGSYINSLGQPQMSDSLRSPFPLTAPAPAPSVGALSESSSARSTPTPNAVTMSQTLSSDTLHPPPRFPPATPVAATPTAAAAGTARGEPMALTTHSISVSGTPSGTASGSASGPGSIKTGSLLAAAAAARLRAQPLVRSHRAAVRAVLSMPCDPIPEDQRAAYVPLPPFVSSGARRAKSTAAAVGPPDSAPASRGAPGVAGGAAGGASVYDIIQKKRIAKVEGAAVDTGDLEAVSGEGRP